MKGLNSQNLRDKITDKLRILVMDKNYVSDLSKRKISGFYLRTNISWTRLWRYEKGWIFCDFLTSVVITQEYNVMVNSEELIVTKDHLTL